MTSDAVTKTIEKQRSNLNTIIKHSYEEQTSKRPQEISEEFYQSLHAIIGELEQDLKAKFG